MHKFISVISIILFLFLILTACQLETIEEEPTVSDERFGGLDADKIKIITDSETGCKYIYVIDGTGSAKTRTISPLMRNAQAVDCK